MNYNNFKIALQTALSGLLYYAIYLPVRRIPFVREFLWEHRTFMEVVDMGTAALVLLCIAIACIAIFVHRNQLPAPNKQLRVLSHIAAWSTLAIVIFPPFHDVWIFGTPMFYIEWWFLEIIILFAAAFVWKYSTLPMGADSLPKSLSTLVLFAAFLSIVVLLLIFFAGCYVLCTGHVFRGGLGTFCYFSWLRVFVPAILFPCYTIHITSDEKLSVVREYIYRAVVWIGFFAALCAMAYYIIDRITILY